MRNTFFTVLFCLAIFHIQAQISFTNSVALLDMQNFHSGVAIGVTDVNNDGLDDIIRLQEGEDLYIEFQQTDGTFVSQSLGNMSSVSEWSLCAADITNNGWADIITGGAYNNVKLSKANSTTGTYTKSNIPSPSVLVQGTNFADINNDGWLDLFVCNDVGESKIWGNDGTGNLVPQDGWIDMTTTPMSDNSGNYGSVWCDFDYDGDLDLYIAKCRQGVTNPADPRRINALFVNDGAGNFTENAAAYGLANNGQSWTADFADYDNDGDFDCFITQHLTDGNTIPSQLLRNDGNTFTDVTAGSGIAVNGMPIQGVMKDFDNDGYLDLLISGSVAQFFHNNGNGTFTEITGLFDSNDMESFAIGDLNHDGFLDIYGGYAGLFNNPSSIDDALWMNDGNSNNYIAVRLEGVISNKDAIGAKVELYGSWGIQVREVRAGESYSIVNSFTQHFGIGAETDIDKIVVRWPSGIVDEVLNPIPNQFVHIVENNCTTPNTTISYSGTSPVVCSGSTLDLIAPSGYSYQWSTGETTQSVTISSAGTYSLTVTDGAGCPAYNFVDVVADPDMAPSISVSGTLEFCEGESVTLSSSAANNVWSTGETTQSISVSSSGSYQVTAQGECVDLTSNNIDVNVLAAPAPTASGQTINFPQSVTLTATGNDISWYDSPSLGSLLGIGASYTTPILNATTTYYVEDRYLYAGSNYDASAPDHTGSSLYSGSQFNGEVIFDAMENFVLKTVKVYSDTPGTRIIELRDASGAVLASEAVFVNGTGTAEVITLDFNIPIGSGWVLSTNVANNIATFGNNSPELRRSSFGVTYPYAIPDVLSVNGSNLGSQYYYYFYDWKIETQSNNCISTRTPVTVTFDAATSVSELEENKNIRMFPNPTDSQVNFEMSFEGNTDVQISLMDITGRIIMSKDFGRVSGQEIRSLDVSDLPMGIYTVRITANNETFGTKLVVR